MNGEDLETCKAIIYIAIHEIEDLPDGMGEEIKEAYEAYKSSKNQETLIEDIKEICNDWGFLFN